MHIDTAYPFEDTANITVESTSAVATMVKVRIPAWAVHATVNGKAATNGTLFTVLCAAGRTAIVVDLAPQVLVEQGWGDTLNSTPAGSVAITRGPLVFALHPRENRTIVRHFATVPSHAGEHAPDYLITTNVRLRPFPPPSLLSSELPRLLWGCLIRFSQFRGQDNWNFALDVAKEPRFVLRPSANWSTRFAFDDSGQYPFAIEVMAHEATDWGYWRGSNITAPPPVSPAASSGPATKLQLVPFGSTNIRISVFPTVG